MTINSIHCPTNNHLLTSSPSNSSPSTSSSIIINPKSRHLFSNTSFFAQFLTLICFTFFSGWLHANDADTELTVTTSHGFALYGDLKYPRDFKHFDYVKPDAPKGGAIRLMGFGSFDTLNPYTLKGISPINSPGLFMYGFSEETDSLLVGTEGIKRSGDEPQSAYGLIAESITYPDDVSWAIFTIRPDAVFQDGHAIDADDVVFSWKTLIKEGNPQFKQTLKGVKSVISLNARQVKVIFKKKNSRADLLRFGEMPVLAEHYWKTVPFNKTSLTPPVISGPYKITNVQPGKSIVFERDPSYWGADLGVNKGRYNFDKVQFDFYRDQTIAFEAFKSEEFDVFIDYTAKNWAAGYDFPALHAGKVLKQEIQHQIPSGTQGLFFNTRKTLFHSVKVREALSLLFDFEWMNRNIFHDAYTRNHSFYPNSDFDSSNSPPSVEENLLLAPFKPSLPPEAFSQPFTPSKHNGNGNIRKAKRTALKLLKEAGWELRKGLLYNKVSNQPFEFEILIRQPGMKRVIEPYIKNLGRVGITATGRLVDANQYKVRLDNFDYDMTTFVLGQSLSPSHEQRDYFHSSAVNVKGSRNYAGVNLPAVDFLTDKIIRATSRQELILTTKALDRVLLWNHYIVPNWHLNYHRIAYWNRFGKPVNTPPYKLGFENWWIQNPQ